MSVEPVNLVCGKAHGELVCVETTEDGDLPKWCEWRGQRYWRFEQSRTYVYNGGDRDGAEAF